MLVRCRNGLWRSSWSQSWLIALDQSSYEQVVAALELLGERGPQLGRPLVDTVKASVTGT